MISSEYEAILEALACAPIGEEDLSPEEVAEIDKRAAELESGSVVGVSHAQVQNLLSQLARKAG